ncbi:ATP-binding protein [Saccharothrix longispora]|uniref:ATP-binding protein n=1 Tax=Saccharothrix longispora TaxID=33920 RepID=UPI0028FD1696|nr:tetratricopeptide repeat protein [Saccharothrix longispora]MBY8849599.1 tetratricopeptide repeat protein [Saccharothrix sp. MB29]MDU0293695.1 tetratricopeptide repeat protein [Saccharothrix longispora]
MWNEAGGPVAGHVVQAGSIGHVSLAGRDPAERHPVPRQLPLVVRDFTGRVGHLAALDALVPGAEAGAGSNSVVLAVVDGPAGVGKTALAVRWAHRVQHLFTGGTLYADLRAHHPGGPGGPAAPGDVLGGFLGALGVPPEWVPAEPEARAGLYRSVLAGRRVLIVLDDADGVEQVRPLLPGAAGCAVVVTSRGGLAGLVVGEGATRVPLDLCTERESLELVRAILGARRVDAEPEAVTGLIRACARLPLALRVAAGRAVIHPYLTVAELVAELGRDRWEVLSVPADARGAVLAVFDCSYRRLTGEQALVLRRLGLHPGPEFGAHAAAAASGLPLADARRVLDTLADSHLVERVARDRYRFHDLLHAYAADRAERDDGPHERERARRNLLEWYAHHARAAYRAVLPHSVDRHIGAAVDLNAEPGIDFADAAGAWAEAEWTNVTDATRATARHGLPRLTVLLATIAASALYLRGHWDDAFEVCDLGLVAARATGDRAVECGLLQRLAHAHQGNGRLREAEDICRTALLPATELDDPHLRAEVLANLGWVCVERGGFAEAREHLLAALPLSAGAHGGRLEGFIEYNLSGAALGLGEHDRALRHAERGLALVQDAGDDDVASYAVHRLAQVRQSTGAHAEAVALCERALAGESLRGDPRHRAAVLDTLATSLGHLGDAPRAVGCRQEALAVFERFGDVRARALGALLDGPPDGG